jgi:hypothetical protein
VGLEPAASAISCLLASGRTALERAGTDTILAGRGQISRLKHVFRRRTCATAPMGDWVRIDIVSVAKRPSICRP